MKAIILNIEAAMASCGELAVGDTRTTLPYMTQSQLLGMVASACGIHRMDPQLVSFMKAWDVVTLTANAPMMKDFQTANNTLQLNDERNKGNQILTKYYLTGFKAMAALLPKPEILSQLDEVIERLKRPANPLYIGRKACSLSGPIFSDYKEYDDIYTLLSDMKGYFGRDATALVPAHFIEEGELICLSDRRYHHDRLFSPQHYRMFTMNVNEEKE